MDVPRGSTAVMARRVEALDSLDMFPTPPWATRALMAHVISVEPGTSVWEPAVGMGHMAEVLAEQFDSVIGSDVHDYGVEYRSGAPLVGSYVGKGGDVVPNQNVDWVITNPPFRLAVEFAERALQEVRWGVALLVRSAWAEGADRYRRLFAMQPPNVIAQFVERVPMVKGRWLPNADTATAYSWFVWFVQDCTYGTRFMWIPPGSRDKLSHPLDVQRFAHRIAT